MVARLPLALALALVPACGKGSATNATPTSASPPDSSGAPVVANAPAPAATPAAARPLALERYPDRAIRDTGDLGAAADGTLLAATDGSEVELSALWAESDVVLVFYRGHW